MANRDLSHPKGDWAHGSAPANGVDIHYVREGTGAPVILLHGWPEFWWGWHKNIPALADHFDTVAPDLRGFGDTKETADVPAGLDVHADDILALADHLGLERFGIASHDVGAYVAQAVARRAPDRISGLFFFNGPHPGIGRRWVEATHIREIWYQSFNQLPWAADLIGYNRDTCRIFFESMLRHWAHVQEAFDGQVDFFVDNFFKPGNIEGGFAWYKASHESRVALIRDGAPDLPLIKPRSRFFWGRHDPILRCDWADTLGDYFADAEVEIAEGAGHFVHFEIPDAANARLIDFFRNRVS